MNEYVWPYTSRFPQQVGEEIILPYGSDTWDVPEGTLAVLREDIDPDDPYGRTAQRVVMEKVRNQVQPAFLEDDPEWQPVWRMVKQLN